MHPASEALMRYFAYEHLPPHLAKVSEPFCTLARRLTGPEFGLDGPELTVCLRKLLESKDCAVRAALSS